MPKVSVIIPAYDAGKYLRGCLDSILGQTLRDIEVFCIDDGSTDDTAAILAEYAKRDSRMRLLSTNHVGAYKARREGLALASGEYVYFMDADDELKTDALKELVDRADAERLDEIVFTADVFSDDGDEASLESYRERFIEAYALDKSVCGKVMAGADLFRELCRAKCYFPGPPMRITRRSAVWAENCTFPEAPFHGDNYFTTASLYNSARACALDCRYYRRRVRAGSITTSVNTEKIHFLSTLNVVVALCSFPPFMADAVAGHPSAVWYLRRLHATLMKWADKIKLDELAKLCKESDDGGKLAAFFVSASRPLAIDRRNRPNSIRGCVRYILRRIFGRKG